jgi:hypothetical protein
MQCPAKAQQGAWKLFRLGSEPDFRLFLVSGSDPDFDFRQLAHSLSHPAPHTPWPPLPARERSLTMPIDLLVALVPFFAIFVLWVLED